MLVNDATISSSPITVVLTLLRFVDLCFSGCDVPWAFFFALENKIYNLIGQGKWKHESCQLAVITEDILRFCLQNIDIGAYDSVWVLEPLLYELWGTYFSVQSKFETFF